MFADHFHDDLAIFADVFQDSRGAAPRTAFEGAALADPARLVPLLVHFGEHTECTEARARASQWSKYFFARLGIATLVVQAATDRALAFDLTTLAVVCDDDATTAQFLFPGDAVMATDTPGHDFSALIDAAFAPVVSALSRHCGLAPRVFWSNAGVYFHWALGELERQGRLPAARLARIRALTSKRRRPDGGFNPFCRVYKPCPPDTLDGNDEPADHCRRLCCMRDLEPSLGLCSNCPRAMHLRAPKRATG
ncbi:ferric iron reductase [Salinisphaera sp. T5B8]|uniref:siderophore-iron reductase FhuF n=1 Tax=Salinisphaera sp. T5B8 TaxID=1304154 RepID=UPI00333FDB46